MFECVTISDMNILSRDLIPKLRNDIIVVILIIIAAFLTFLIPRIMNGGRSGGVAVIMQEGEEICRYALSEDRTVTVQGADHGYNLILISDGTVNVTDADCPDKLCVRQKSISKNGESIICLPHKLVILIESSEESDLDAVTN